MVQANLNGHKSCTRRTKRLETVNHSPDDWMLDGAQINGSFIFHNKKDRTEFWVNCPYGQPGDVLWQRETYMYILRDHAHDLLEGRRENNQHVYKTQFHEDWIKYAKEKYGYKWTPNIHMPKTACRFWMEVTNVSIQRLQDITRGDAMAEGCPFPNIAKGPNPRDWFCDLWIQINGVDSWNSNPWVWVIEYAQTEMPDDFL